MFITHRQMRGADGLQLTSRGLEEKSRLHWWELELKPIDINRYLEQNCGGKKNLTGEGWRGVTGDMMWKGGTFARDRLREAQAGRGVLWVLAGSLDSILRAGVELCWWTLEQHWLK